MKIILHVLAMSSYSGAENVVCQIITMFSADSDVRMIYCSPAGQIRRVLEEKNIEYEPMNDFSIRELRRVIKKVNPNIIHAHDVRATFFASLVCGNITFISHMHNNWENLRKPSLKGWLYFFAVRKASTIVWVSDSAFKQFRYSEKLKKKSLVLKNIIDVEAIRGTASNSQCEKSYDIVNVGRLMYQKNPERFVNVIEKTVRHYPKLKAVMIGDGELSDSIHDLIASKNLEGNVDMLGYIEKPLGIVKNAKVFLMTSRWEGTPMCILEALTLGIPVVGTPVDGMLDLVQDGENGYLSDDDKALSEHLLEILEEDDLRDRLSKTAFQYSDERNSIKEYKQKLEKIYGVR